MTISAFAPAKINLNLHVGRPFADGRHPIDSLVTFADVGDAVEAAPAPDGALALEIDGPFAAALASEADNLVLRAARLLQAHKGVALGARLRLTKRLPIASGIGGGSSDAAAALRVLDALWGGPATPVEDLCAIAARLGADVPVCVALQPARLTGDGRETAAIALPRLSGVLVNPGTPASTALVYRAFDDLNLGDGFSPSPLGPFRDGDELLSALAEARNDLEPAALRVAPVIEEALALVGGDPDVALARMSGSGATCFGLTRDRAAAERAARRLAEAQPNWWVEPADFAAIDAATAGA
jgi:4-diphosphocytidyl-2-C-methyl-D-erythritol kinase